ncbi:MAG: dethiobiotin synthase, partial [Balneolaceae bacterium]
GLQAEYWKPVQSGLEPRTDSDAVAEWAGMDADRIHSETYRLNTPMSPHASAEIDGVEIDLNAFSLPECRRDHLIVEGAGGILVPLNREEMILDLMVRLNLPVLLVARSTLGTLNHTLMSLQVMRSRGLSIWGVVLNGPYHPSNEQAILHYGKPRHLFRSLPLETINADTLNDHFNQTFRSDVTS